MSMSSDGLHDDERAASMLLAEAKILVAEGEEAAARQHLIRVLSHAAPLQVARARIDLAWLHIQAAEIAEAVALIRLADATAHAFAAPEMQNCELLLDVAAAWLSLGHPLCARSASQRAIEMLRGATSSDGDGQSPANRRRLAYFMGLARLQLARSLGSSSDLPQPGDVRIGHWREARSLREPLTSPFAALELAICAARDGRDPMGLLREAIAYDHPEASVEAMFERAAAIAWHGRSEDAGRLFQEVASACEHPVWADAAEKALRVLPAPPERSRIAAALDEAAKMDVPHDSKARPGTRVVLIVGAGMGGQFLYRDLQRSGGDGVRIAGFVDDDVSAYRRGVPLAPGVEVLGRLEELSTIITKHKPHEVYIAMPTAVPAVKRRIVKTCLLMHTTVRTLPVPHEIVRGGDLVAAADRPSNLSRQLRDVSIEDIVGEQTVYVRDEAATWLRNENVMVIGCGAVGRQLAVRAARAGAESIVVVDRDEVTARRCAYELGQRYQHPNVHGVAGPAVKAQLLIERAQEHHCTLLFHTASASWSQIGDSAISSGRDEYDTIIQGLASFADRLDEVPSLRALTWIANESVAAPATPAAAVAAIAEAVMLSPGASHVQRCSVRIPSVFTSRSGLIDSLRLDAAEGYALRVPPAHVHGHFIHAYAAAELILFAAQLGEPLGVYGVEEAERQSINELARILLQLHGRSTEDPEDIVEDPKMMVAERPPLRGRATEIPNLVALGPVHDHQGLREELATISLNDDPRRLVARAQQLCAHASGFAVRS